MINKLIKKIGFICLGLASIILAGCFHIPDEDWLLSNENSEPKANENDDFNQVLDSFMNNMNTISSQRDEMKNHENDGEQTEKLDENHTGTENNEFTGGENTTTDEILDEEMETLDIEE